jgi:glycerol-3-phosphate dehydrogenase
MKMESGIERTANTLHDVVIIGGGITGAAIAYEAASRGLSAALFEKSDFGGATSAATSKLIHGGLRYLANGEFGIIRESLKERRVLSNIAPNYVYPIPCLLPHYRHSPVKVRKTALRIAMVVYDILSAGKNNTWDGSKGLPVHASLGREETLRREPLVPGEGLTGAFLYYDCDSISPERLTLAFIKSALARGAAAHNYAKVEEFTRDGKGRITGVTVRDLAGSGSHTVRGRCVINCAGPWADQVLELAAKGSHGHALRRSEGIHLLVPRMAGDHMLGVQAPGRQRFFIRPWRNHSLIGTTDSEYGGDPDGYRVMRKSIEDLLENVNAFFGRELVRYSDIRAAYGGLRPLVDNQTEKTYTSSRKYEIYDHAGDGCDGLLTVEGGKYTTSRNLAEQLVALAGKKIGAPLAPVVSDATRLHGCEIPDLERFMERCGNDYSDFSPETADFIGRHYGTESGDVIALARSAPGLAEQVNESGEIMAQVAYAVSHERAVTLTDILKRRTGIGLLGYPGDRVIEKIAVLAGEMLSWDAKRKDAEMDAARNAMIVP